MRKADGPGFWFALAYLGLGVSLAGCAAGSTAGPQSKPSAFATKTTVKAGALVVRGTGRAIGATTRTLGSRGDEPR